MMGRTGGGREKYRSEYNHPRFEDKGSVGISRDHQLGRSEALPSRHLWVGNLPPRVTQGMLLEQFLRFGDLENIAFIPGRSYAFINFKREDDAIYALRTLQGQMFAGLPLKIEFQKGDKLSASSSLLNGEYGRGERNSADRGESFHLRDLHHDENFVRHNINEEPSEFLRIGFPPHFNIDRYDLERAFSPFGDLERVLIFPSLGYAIIRYRSIVAACLAKDALQGRLFNNPHVSISFARNDGGPFDFPPLPSPRFFPPEMETIPRERETGGFDRRVSEDRADLAALGAPWDANDRLFSSSSSKRMKTDSFPDRELPEYPFSNYERESLPRQPESHIYNRSLISDYGDVENNDSRRKFDARTKHENQPISLNDWRWEGTIAKGGTPICRARCFPVGKALDFALPQFLDCTARTGLDMLERHFYRASSSWVVFFVPETDADIVFYNEFMHFLGEKNRAAVAKLEDKTTLFLVPPSEFSEKVLKVPGKMSISGVILRFLEPSSELDPVGSTGLTFPPMPTSSVDESMHRAGRHLLLPSKAAAASPREGNNYFSHLPDPFVPPASLSYPGEETAPLKGSSGFVDAEAPPSPPVKPPLLPEQLAQLASFLGQRSQSGKGPQVSEQMQSAVSLSSQLQQLQRQAVNAAAPAPETAKLEQLSSQLAHGSSQEEPEADPQRRLQATLQLAATLLQQIQQQSKPDS